MAGDREALRDELKRLKDLGGLLYLSMAKDVGGLDNELLKKLRDSKVELPSFKTEFDAWYSVALELVRQVLPARVGDFEAQYKIDRRKEVDFLTYTISDYLIGLQTTFLGEVRVDGAAALPKFERQIGILDAAIAAFDSRLVDIEGVLQADLFDSELDAAAELGTRGFHRGGGAIAGVVLERHLAHVCGTHGLRTRKKTPSIGDFNDMLKKAGVVDTAKWRFIQHLADLRNLCDHAKDREPTGDDVSQLVEGVRKVARTVS